MRRVTQKEAFKFELTPEDIALDNAIGAAAAREHDDESPELLAAIDAGLESLKRKGVRVVTRKELEDEVQQ